MNENVLGDVLGLEASPTGGTCNEYFLQLEIDTSVTIKVIVLLLVDCFVQKF